MARNNAAWMEFKGARSDALGAAVVELPKRLRAAERGEAVKVPGRHGSLWVSEGAYDDVQLEVKLRMGAASSWEALSAWLTGSGNLRFSDDPTRVYRARAAEQFAYERFLPGARRDHFLVKFDCQPFRYQAVPAPMVLTADGFVENPGSVPAQPVITIYGAGDVDLMVGGATAIVTGISGQLTLDCENKIAYRAAGSELVYQNGRVNLLDGWPVLAAGRTAVSWTNKAGAPRIQIEPNWRWL